MNRSDVLHRAEECVCGHREQDYGEMEDNFGLIAGLWGKYLGYAIYPYQVAAMMVLLKVARTATGKNGGTEDCWVDIAGYAACGGEIVTEVE